MEVLKLKILKNKKISSYLIEKPIRAINMSKIQCLVNFLTEKDIKFITIDMEHENLKDSKKSKSQPKTKKRRTFKWPFLKS